VVYFKPFGCAVAIFVAAASWAALYFALVALAGLVARCQ
jgi:hypothetical protein